MDSPVNEFVQSQEIAMQEGLTWGEGAIFKGAPNTGFAGGPAVSPEFQAALAQSGAGIPAVPARPVRPAPPQASDEPPSTPPAIPPGTAPAGP